MGQAMLIMMLDLPLIWIYNNCMMNEMKEELAMDLYGRSLELSRAGQQCVKCGEFNLEFRDEISRREYAISGWCQSCQDQFFGA